MLAQAVGDVGRERGKTRREQRQVVDAVALRRPALVPCQSVGVDDADIGQFGEGLPLEGRGVGRARRVEGQL